MKIQLIQGSEFYSNGAKYLFKAKKDIETIYALNMETNTIESIYIADISEGKGTSAQTPELHYIETKNHEMHYNIAKNRLKIIQPLLNRPSKQDVINRANEVGVSYVTLYKWIKSYVVSGGLLSSLIPKYNDRGGPNKARINSDTDKVINDLIMSEYLTNQRKSKKSLYIAIVNLCKELNIPKPSQNTVYNRIAMIKPETAQIKRFGAKPGYDKYGAIEDKFKATHPLSIIQIDHTVLDIILVDEKYRKPIGRPYITAAMDIYSRLPYGVYLSLDNPSYFTVGQSILMGIQNKKKLLNSLGITDGEWPIWGLPNAVTIHTDNAKEFSGRDLEFFCNEFGINLAHRPKKKPQFGGHIERFIGTINTKVHELPGTTFSNSKDRGEYNSESKSTLTLSELEKWLFTYLSTIYNKTTHSELGISPIEQYEKGILGYDDTPGTGYPDIIQGEYLEKMRITLLPSFLRTIQRDGVTFEEITYFSDSLRKYIKAKDGAKGPTKLFLFRYDPRNIRQLYFYDPDLNDYLPIPYRSLHFPPMSIWELKEVKKRLKAENITRYSEHDIFAMYRKLQEIEETAKVKTKEVRRKTEKKSHHAKKTKVDDNTKLIETKYESSTKRQISDSPESNVANNQIIFEVDL